MAPLARPIDLAAGGFVLAISFAFSAAIVYAVRKTALRRQWLDHPNDRSSHTHPTPRGGGIGIVLATVLVSVGALAATGSLTRPWLVLFGAALVVAGVSWIDDLRSLPSVLRLFVHVAAAALVVWSLGPMDRIAITRTLIISMSGFAVPVTVLWIAGMTNVYNFMDGIDGIAGLQGILAGVSWMIIAAATGRPAIAIGAAALAAACGGFLIYNWHPATIFMGDVGSAFIGFTLASFPLAFHHDPRALPAGILIVWPFVFDEGVTMIGRLRKRENIMRPHRSHIYQRLVRSGFSHAAVTTIYGGLAVLSGVAGVSVMLGAASWPVALAPLAAAAAGTWLFMRRAERRNGASREWQPER